MEQVVLNGRDAVLRSPTGSGKTLAYLIPLLTGISNELLDEDINKYLCGAPPLPRATCGAVIVPEPLLQTSACNRCCTAARGPK